MRIILLLCIVLALAAVGFYLYVDTNDPVIAWGVEDKSSINHALKINIADDVSLDEVCFTVSGGKCPGEKECLGGLNSSAYELMIELDKCVVDASPTPVNVTVDVVDTAIIANRLSSSIELVYDNQAPVLATLKGSHSLQQGGTGVVLYEVGEVPKETGIILDDLLFRSFAFEERKYLSLYAHPYNVAADDFKPRVFAVDHAGNFRKIRPGSRTASRAYRSEVIDLSDQFLENVKDKMMASSTKTPLEVFLEVNNTLRQQNHLEISRICQESEPRKLWDGVFLRNQGATKAGFADSRAYRYDTEVVSQAVHTGMDIAGVNNTPIFAANHGRVIHVGEIGIYGNVVIIDHGYGLHTLYGHLHQAQVQEADEVRKGDVIGTSGETGLVFGDHLHFEMRVSGVPVNPVEWFDEVWVKSNIESYMP